MVPAFYLTMADQLGAELVIYVSNCQSGRWSTSLTALKDFVCKVSIYSYLVSCVDLNTGEIHRKIGQGSGSTYLKPSGWPIEFSPANTDCDWRQQDGPYGTLACVNPNTRKVCTYDVYSGSGWTCY